MFLDDSLELPKPKLVSVQSVTYLDSNGTRQTLAGGDYEVITDELVGRLVPAFGKSWPSCRLFPGSVQVSYTCGYGAAVDVPQSIKAWMLLAIGAWYENRESRQPASRLPSCRGVSGKVCSIHSGYRGVMSASQLKHPSHSASEPARRTPPASLLTTG